MALAFAAAITTSLVVAVRSRQALRMPVLHFARSRPTMAWTDGPSRQIILPVPLGDNLLASGRGAPARQVSPRLGSSARNIRRRELYRSKAGLEQSEHPSGRPLRLPYLANPLGVLLSFTVLLVWAL